MKKTLKLLVSTVTTVAILAASVFTTLADGTGTITVKNATVGETYEAYQIFNSEVNGASVNYTLIGAATTDANKALLETSGSPFTASATGDISVSTTDNNAITSFVKKVIADNPSAFSAAKTIKADSQTVVFDTLDFGYYFVSSTLGTAVSITSATPNATVVDKNDMPSWNPQPVEPNNPDNPVVTPPTDLPTPPQGTTDDGKFVSDTGDNGSYAKVSTSGINQTEYFMISAHCPALAGSNTVVSYIFTDTLADGFTYNNDAALYTNNNGVLTPVSTGTFTATPNGQKITFTYVVPTDYAGAELVIKYTATTDKDAVYDNVNKVDMDWTYIPYGGSSSDYDNDPDTPKPTIPSTQDPTYPGSPSNTTTPTKPADPESPNYDPAFPPTPDTSKTDTYVYKFELIKIDATSEETIDGAEFKLYSDAACETEISVFADGDNAYRVADSKVTGDPATITAGDVTIFGLDKGTYYVKETKAPNNYNLLKSATPVNIKTEINDGVVKVEVANSKGSELPSTGGMGTTIFIVAGSILMAGGLIGIITKKRMSLKDEEQ